MVDCKTCMNLEHCKRIWPFVGAMAVCPAYCPKPQPQKEKEHA